ncbi:uncharacterized protein LOC111712353 [Eurytemora carolleeae]|uniref:uncharacterized protein LOC111712353 n=1 Tax=Eurytemora carolleeae TaxID=1294199 RepID=UPI000C76FCDB|nr:uncharacterized protein LOC111712353 [Eurytemora carolleeae]|eukprot:XP_023342702.1 uncharacterized protein LOC111712353 [Eurytemora affinis]
MTSAGSWRRPRMKVYDYNQEFGGNYYQPMIQYLNKKEIYGPYHTRTPVYLPHSAEVTSDKFNNMRYTDKSSAKHNLDDFLKNAYRKQIKETNGTTAAVHYNQLHDAGGRMCSPYSDRQLLGCFAKNDRCRKEYLRELSLLQSQREREERDEMGESLYNEIKQRNRLARIRDACRDMMNHETPSFSLNMDSAELEPDYTERDPLNPEMRDRLESARQGLNSEILSAPWLGI